MLLKSCRCGKLIPQSVKMCEECERRQQSRHMIYNNTRRDKRAAEFYVSKEWRAMRERIIEVYDNVDILRERVVIVEQSLKSYHKRLDGEQHSDR